MSVSESGGPREDKSDASIAGPLRASGIVAADGLERAEQFQKLHGGLLSDAVLRLELIREQDFLRVFAEIYSTRFVKADKLSVLKIDDPMLERISVRDCERLRVCPFRWDAERQELHVVAAVPLQAELALEVRRITGARSTMVYIATAGAVRALIRRWHYREKDAFAELTPNGAGPLPTLPKVVADDASDARTQATGSLEGMLQQLRRENERFKAAQEFSRRVTLERSQDAMIERILNVLFELLPAETAAISLQNGKYAAKVRRAGQMADVPRSVLERTLESQSGILVNNALIDERFGRSESVMIRGIKSLMAVPLKARDQVLGVLYVDSVSQS
ncbi:MAG: GAF domain-containing protein, partial [Myxococcaceae bacterium]